MSSYFLILKNQISTQSHKSGQAWEQWGNRPQGCWRAEAKRSLAEAAGCRRLALCWGELKSEVFILKPRYTPLFPNILALKKPLSSFILVIEFWNSDITFILLIFLAGPEFPQKTHAIRMHSYPLLGSKRISLEQWTLSFLLI